MPAASTLPWSLFALSTDDIRALEWLASKTILVPCDGSDVARLTEEMRGGRIVALSIRDRRSGAYCGLCVLGRETPSPWPEKSLAVLALTFEQYIPQSQPGRPSTSHPDLFEEVLRFCRTHGYVRLHCYSPADSSCAKILTDYGFNSDGRLTLKQRTYYSWSMELPTPYTGDPCDGSHILNWLGERFRLESVESKSDTTLIGRFPLRSLNPHLEDRLAGNLDFPTQLQLVNSHSADWSVELRMSDREDTEAITLGQSELQDLTQSRRINLSDWPPGEHRYSLAVEIRKGFFDLYEPTTKHAFLDSGHYGTLLSRTLARGNESYIFFIDVETAQSNPLLLGAGRITGVDHGSPLEIWTKHGEISSWKDAESFRRYGSIKRKMTAVLFEGLTLWGKTGAGLPMINHSWTYVPGRQAYEVARSIGLE